jgi:hypothetical protein
MSTESIITIFFRENCVAILKATIKSELGAETQNQLLTFAGTQLDDGETLNSYSASDLFLRSFGAVSCSSLKAFLFFSTDLFRLYSSMLQPSICQMFRFVVVMHRSI